MLKEWRLAPRARCRPDAMNEKFRKFDTHFHDIFYGLYKETRVQMVRIHANYIVGIIKLNVYGH